MKLIVFLIFAGCAVKCDESGNYYVIERPANQPVREQKPFHVYWNVPTFQCKSKKVSFENLFEKYGIIQNQNDTFQGEQITILYDPGLFPAILKEENSGKLRTRNGGVPQEGNLDEHLTAFRYALDQSIPDSQFSGVGIIDFESWRPVFRQNFFGVLTPYRNLSLAIERQLHPWWTKNMIEKEAKFRFERAGREFMQATVALARLLRPRARWGYYGFPYCFNMAGSKPAETCSSNIQKENDQIAWLWSESTALYPSVYSSKSLTSAQLAALIRGRVAEGARVGRGAPILPYFWFKYRDAGFMSEVDLKTALKAMYKSQTSGLILWGSSNDVNTVTKCEKLKNYLEQILGPEIAKYTKQVYKTGATYDISNDTKMNNVTTQNPFDLMTSDSKDDETVEAVDSDSDEINENNPENIQSKLDDEIMSNANDSDKNTDEKNILIDIVLSLIENVQKSGNKEKKETTMKRILKDRKKGTPIHDTFTNTNENYTDFTTISPIRDLKKKGALFTLLYSIKTTTEPNEIYSTTDNSLTTEHDLQYNTVEPMYNNDYFTTYYNQDTFLDEEFNYTTVSESNTENTETVNDENIVSLFFEDGLNYTKFTQPTTEAMAVNFEEERHRTVASYTSQKNTKQLDSYATNLKETTTDNVISTTDITTTGDTDALHDTVDVDDETKYQVPGSSQVDRKFFICLFFYLYSVSKCLCDVYGQC